MPNAKVTFDRFWTSHLGPSAALAAQAGQQDDLVATVQGYIGGACQLPSTYNPFPQQIP
jgi:hypothetical protein